MLAAQGRLTPGASHVDLEAKVVTIRGVGLDDLELRAAIGEAGYEAA